MSIEQEIAGLTQSTTDLLDAVNTKKATLDSAVATAEAAKAEATSKAAEAVSTVANADDSATQAAASASQAAASAASASQIVTGVATGLPKVRPSLNLDFVNSKTVDSRIDFTRSTTASYYDGKATVKAEENLLSYSSVDYFGLARMTRTSNATVAPDGTTTATALIATTEDNTHTVYASGNVISGESVTYSVYLKAGVETWASISMYSNATGGAGEAFFDLSNGVVGTVVFGSITRSIQDVGNGWYRCSITADPSEITASTPMACYIWTRKGDGVASAYVGDGTSTSLYAWGAQLEQRDTLTAYTPTAGTPITNYIPVLQTADINKPRLDHDPITGECKGLLMEESRTNLCAYSEDMSSGNFYGFDTIEVDTNVIIAPDGTLTTDKIIPLVDNGRRADHFTVQGTMVEGATYTLSGFYKADGSHYTRVKLGGVFGGEDAIFDFDTGEFVYQNINVTNAKAEDVGNGWWRLSVSYVFQNHINNNYPYALIAQPLLSNNSTVAPSYTGYNGVYVWGVQYEKAAFATSYIPTDGATVTRSIDSAVVTGVNLSDAFNNSEFSMYAEMQRTGSNSTSQEFAGIELSSDTFQGNVLSLAYDSGSFDRANARLFNANKGMTVLLSAAGSTPNFEDGEEITKFAFGLKQGDSRLYAQGLSNPSASTSLTTTPFTPEYLRIQPDNIRDTFSNFCGYCRKVSLYPKRLPDTELQALTQE